jgi:hypothetical protein
MSNTIQFSELLKQAVTEAGILSDAYKAFHNYSIGNQLAAITQCISRGMNPAPISTFKGWQEKGRNVKKGEKAIALCMPVTCKGEKENKSTGQTEEFSFSRFMWRNNWFVLTQTEGVDYVNEEKTPQWSAEAALVNLDITQAAFTETNGNCQGYASGRMIAINPLAIFPHKTRFHEIAHIVLGHTEEHTMTDSELTPRDIREVEAESVAYILCSILGLSGLEESRGYIQHWLDCAEVSEKSAQKIFSTADKILKAGQTA